MDAIAVENNEENEEEDAYLEIKVNGIEIETIPTWNFADNC